MAGYTGPRNLVRFSFKQSKEHPTEASPTAFIHILSEAGEYIQHSLIYIVVTVFEVC